MEIVKMDAPVEMNGEQQIYCQKDMLAILGTAETLGAAPYDDEKYEIWGVAQCMVFPAFRRGDMLFEMHKDDYWKDENVLPRLKTWDMPLVMHDHYEELPHSVKYPKETILGTYRPYHRTSISFMLALAYH